MTATEPFIEKCPFCGGEARYYTLLDEYPYSPTTFHIVRCNECETTIESTTSLSDVVSRWNRRVKI